MQKLFKTIGLIYMVLFIFMGFGVAASASVSASEWEVRNYHFFEPSFGDYFMVDIKNGIGYLINDNTRKYTLFPLITGNRGTPTPEKEWVVKEKNIQSNRVIFSESGEFFRMYTDGDKRTGYGIHGYAYFEKEIANGRKFLSRGCVLVADNVLDLIEESYIANGESLKMYTKKEIDMSSYFVALFVALQKVDVDYPRMMF